MGTVSESEESDSDEAELPDFIMDYASSGKEINFGEYLVKKLVLSSIFGLPLCDRLRKKWLDIQKERIVNFAMTLKEIKNLSKNDQKILFQENLGLILCLFGSIFFIRKSDYGNHIKPFISKNDRSSMDLWYETSIMRIEKIPSTFEHKSDDEHLFGDLQCNIVEELLDHNSNLLIIFILLFSIEEENLTSKSFDNRMGVREAKDTFVKHLCRLRRGSPMDIEM